MSQMPRSRRRLRLLYFVAFIFGLSCILIIENVYQVRNALWKPRAIIVRKGDNSYPIGSYITSELVPVNMAHTTSVNWVCIENARFVTDDESGPGQTGHQWYLNNSSIILHPRHCLNIPQKKISIHGYFAPHNPTDFHGFKVYFTENPVPKHFKVLESKVAYFNGHVQEVVEPDNVINYLMHNFFPLHFLLKRTKRLSTTNKDVFTAGLCQGHYVPFPINMAHYYKMLSIENTSGTIFQDNSYPDGVCYKQAVFNNDMHVDHALEAVDFLKENLGIKDSKCKYRNLVTIMQRGSNRKTVNVFELMQLTMKMGYNATVAFMEQLPLTEMIQLMHCTKILVGLQGDDLVWSVFMKDRSAVTEIVWKTMEHKFMSSEWRLHYLNKMKVIYRSPFMGLNPQVVVQVLMADCTIEPSYLNKYAEDVFHMKYKISIHEAKAIIADSRNYNSADPITDITKLCDIHVAKEDLKKALLEVNDETVRLGW